MSTLNIQTEQLAEIGDNVKAFKQGDLLVLVIDTRQDLGLSSSGKMTTVASTGGFTPAPGGTKLNLYLGKKK